MEAALASLDAYPELKLVLGEFQEELCATGGFSSDAAWWRHVECRFALRCLLLQLEENLETAAVRVECKEGHGGSRCEWRKVELMASLSRALEATTAPRLAETQAPRGVQVERRYGLRPKETELFRLLVIRESGTCRWLNRFVSNHSGSDSDSALCRWATITSRIGIQV